jgi:hypothetical protein
MDSAVIIFEPLTKFQMRVKHAIIFLVLGYCLDFVGAILKILHYSYGDEVLITATVLKVSGGIIPLYKILTYSKFKEFLDW